MWISRLYRIAADEPDKPREIESGGEAGPILAISHPARRLAYVREVFDPNIWRLRIGADGKAVGAPTSFIASTRVDFHQVFSPDGKFLYYSKATPRGPSLWRVPVDDGEEVEVLEGFSDATTFSLTDQGIYFIPRRGPTAPASIQFLSFADGQIKTIVAIAKPVFIGLTVSPDGQSILYTQIDQESSDLMLVENVR